MAAVLIIGPIFEADLLPQQYGFRPGLDAKMALRRVYWHVTQHGRREVVDADLRDYFTSIPHTPLMRSLSRRIADGRMLHVIKGWLIGGHRRASGSDHRSTTDQAGHPAGRSNYSLNAKGNFAPGESGERITV
jgi:retron-type reverse transcriptase